MTRKFISVFTFSCFQVVAAQSDWQNWNAIELQANVAPKIGVELGHLRSYNLKNGYAAIFSQTSFQFKYELSRQWGLQAGLQLLTPDSVKDTRSRIYVRAAHTTRISKKVNWTNSLRIETNSGNENRFRQRIIYTARIGLRKRLDFLNLSPSVAWSMFYNIGGNPIRYYDKNAQLIARQTPDGLHRSRLTINLNSKVNDYLRVSLYYMRQQEFNLFVHDTRKMNVYDPVRNRILRPFNNYNTLGVTAQIVLDQIFN